MKTKTALEVQVGGNHYKSFKIQPIEFTMQNGLGFCEGNIIKYVARHKSKNGRQDLEKAKHYIDLLLEQEYPEIKPKAPAKAKKKPTSKANYRPIMMTFELSPELQAVLDTKVPMTRTEVIKGLWNYIRKQNLQDPKNKRNIICDEKFKSLMGKSRVTMFEIASLINRHLK